MAQRVGPSIDAASFGATVFALGWKTSHYCLTVRRRGTTLIWSWQPRV
jgi:hypothetical protein